MISNAALAAADSSTSEERRRRNTLLGLRGQTDGRMGDRAEDRFLDVHSVGAEGGRPQWATEPETRIGNVATNRPPPPHFSAAAFAIMTPL